MCPACLFANTIADDVAEDEPYVATFPPQSMVGPFTIVRLLGKGGMAAVYEAHDPRLDRAVALKVLPPEFLHDDSFAARFEHEARVVARLDHPAIVPIFASGIDEGIPWMSMRLAAGGSLASLLRNRRLPPRDAIGILNQVAAAIDHAHARGVTHRDIKPANILLDRDGNACVADFGLAHLIERNPALTSTGILTGTPHYMAPEQALGKPTGHACDIYSLGIVAYEMVVGHTPFDADSPVALLMKQVNEPLPDPDDCRIPAPLLDVVRKAASKDPSERWESAGAFIAALETAWDDTTTHVAVGGREAARNRDIGLRLVAALLSCALVVAMGWTWFRARHPPVTPIGGLTLIEGASPASSASPIAENVNPPAAAVTVATATRPPTRAATQTPEPVVAESAPPNVTAPAEEPADSRVTATDSAEPKATPELTPPVHIDPAPSIARTESAAASPPRTEKVTAPVRIKTIAPNYPGVARAAQIEGDVVLQAFIDPRGRVTDVTVTRSVHPLLDEAARQAVLRYEYAPGRRDGIPESSTARIIVSFKLQ